MANFQRLMLIASPQMRRTSAFERAVALAKASNAALHIVAFDYMETLAIVGVFNQGAMAELREGYLQMHRHWLEQEAEYERKNGLEVTTQLFWTQHVVDEIRQYVDTQQAEMVIKDVHQESTLKRVFFTPLDWQLLRDCPVPVHVVTDSANPLPHRIVAAVNLFRSADADLRLNDIIIEAASRLAAQCDGVLQMLYVYDGSAVYASGFTIMGAMPIEADFVDALGDAHLEAFVALAKNYGIAKENAYYLTGTPLPAIKKFAVDNSVDVLVMGTRPHHNLDLVLGDTAENILQHAPCSVLVVKA